MDQRKSEPAVRKRRKKKKKRRSEGPIQKAIDKIVILVSISFVFPLPYIPLPILRCISAVLFSILYPAVGAVTSARRRYIRNIVTAYMGEVSYGEARRIARRSMYNLLVGIFELGYYYHRRNRKKLMNNLKVEGLDNLELARRNGNGVVGVSGHMGNFQLMVVRLAREEGINSSFLFKEPKSPPLADVVRRYMDIMGLKRIYVTSREDTMQKTIEELKNSGFVVLIADEYKRYGIEAKFFNQPTLMAAGPAILALRTKSDMVPTFSIREKRSRYRIVIGEPIKYDSLGNVEGREDKENIRHLTQRRTEVLENNIRRYPDQWLWIHSRWNKE